MSAADVEMWLDGVKDIIEDQDDLSAEERVEALRELVEYIEITSIPDALAALPKSKPRRKRKRCAG